MGKAPPAGETIELTATLSTPNVSPSYAVPTALQVISAHRTSVIPSAKL